MTAAPDFRLLGTLEVTTSGERRPLRTGKLRVVLATLLLRANQTVPVDELIDRLWCDDPPAAARNTAQAYVMRLRQALGDDPRNPKLIHTRPSGYQIDVGRDQLDLSRFRHLVELAEGQDPAAATETLHEALAFWRGPALADIPSESLRRDELPRLVEERLRALERRIDLDLELGRHGDLVVELSTLTKEYPLRERFWGQLMLALFRSGRQAEALHTYREIRELLVDQLGVEPGADLQRLHEDILRDDPQLRTGTPSTTVAGVPRQLPADVVSFTGRDQELARLADLAVTSGSVVISAIHGTAGVGKTALAVHFGHTVADRFPDGQLYLDLRGYSATPAMTPGEALERLLRSLGLPPERIPREEQEQAATYRSLLAGKRVLVVLDNARTAEQVEPLLPGYPGCLVVITSRGSLSTVDSATRLQLDVLTEEEALTLLARMAGRDRVEADPEAAATLVELCARLPLAVRIAGARLAARPGWSIGTLVRRLADAQHRLDELQVADRAVRASFAVSYHALKDGEDPVDRSAARVFRVLGMLDWVDMSVPVAAALADLPDDKAHAALERLVDDHLLDSTTPGRYHTHDLLRLYARDRAEDDETNRQAALLRALDCYLTAAELSAVLLNPDTPRIPADPTRAERCRFKLSSAADAAAWIDAEHANLVAVAHQAAGAGDSAAALSVWLTASLNWALNLRGHWRDLIDLRRLGAETANRLGDRPAEALALHDLGWAYWRVGRAADAITIGLRALAAWRELGDHNREQACLSNLGAVYRAENRFDDAIRCYEQGVEICRKIDSRRGESQNLDGMGLVYQRLNRFDDAIACHEKGLAIDRELGHRFGESISLGNLGWAYHRAGQHEAAIGYFRQSLTISREVKDAYQEAEILWGLGLVHHALGQQDQARSSWCQSIDLLRGLGELTDEEAQSLLRQPVPDTPGIIQRNT